MKRKSRPSRELRSTREKVVNYCEASSDSSGQSENEWEEDIESDSKTTNSSMCFIIIDCSYCFFNIRIFN